MGSGVLSGTGTVLLSHSRRTMASGGGMNKAESNDAGSSDLTVTLRTVLPSTTNFMWRGYR